MLRHLGTPLALAITPAAAGLLMAGLAAWPTPATVAAAEVVRKVLAYSLARPARESLFTVVSRAEKYKVRYGGGAGGAGVGAGKGKWERRRVQGDGIRGAKACIACSYSCSYLSARITLLTRCCHPSRALQAKLFLDTVVQRVGDALAAGAFQALVPGLRFGPAGVAAACVPVCALWTSVAYSLGRRQQRLAATAAAAAALAANRL